jgi:hypothetical protein
MRYDQPAADVREQPEQPKIETCARARFTTNRIQLRSAESAGRMPAAGKLNAMRLCDSLADDDLVYRAPSQLDKPSQATDLRQDEKLSPLITYQAPG